MNYMYKGPELEWLALKESRNEKYYDALNKALPREGNITELGCGYGFATYMFHFTGWKRTITAVDADDEKIDVANNCYSKNEQVNFVGADVMKFQIEKSDAFVINEKNLMFSQDNMKLLLKKCQDNLNEGGRIIFIGNHPDWSGCATEQIFDSVYLIWK